MSHDAAGDDAGLDAHPAAESAPEASPDAAAQAPASDGGLWGDADAMLSYDAVAPDAGLAADATGCPPTVAPPTLGSTATVDFVVTNTSTADRYVAIAGDLCEPFSISNVSLLAPFSCVCECTAPSVSVTFHRLPPAASHTISWDGRKNVAYTAYVDCGPAYAGLCSADTRVAAQPVAPGNYTARFAIATAIPLTTAGLTRCIPTASPDEFTCSYPWPAPGAPGPQCDFTNVGVPTSLLEQPFVLPSTGIAMIPVPIQ